MFSFRDRKLGIADQHGRYDLPFHKDQGTDFLMLLIGLMTFLAVIVLAASLVLTEMSQRWSSGLENTITVEISAESEPGTLRPVASMMDLSNAIAIDLRNEPNVQRADVLKKEDIATMLKPWLGEESLIDTLPLPGIITVKLKDSDPDAVQRLIKTIESKEKGVRVDTQDEWLTGLLQLTSALRTATLFIVLVIGATTFLTVAGAVRARMAIHRADVELLHLMGADDTYIMQQFQKHTFILSLKGALSGMLCAVSLIIMIHFLAGSGQWDTLPRLSLGPSHIMLILFTPAIVCMIAALTARFTVLRSLAGMP